LRKKLIITLKSPHRKTSGCRQALSYAGVFRTCSCFPFKSENVMIGLKAESQDSSVGIAMGWTARVLFPTEQNFFLLLSVQTGSGANPASYPKVTGGSFLEDKAAGA
jgi:hypothetical protein